MVDESDEKNGITINYNNKLWSSARKIAQDASYEFRYKYQAGTGV